MARNRRRLEAFSLSFLDVMACGFGAVVLVYMIINHRIVAHSDETNAQLLSEVDRMQQLVYEGERYLLRLRNTLEDVDQRYVETRGLSDRVLETLTDSREELALLDNETQAERDRIERLKSDIQTLEKETQRRPADEDEINAARRFAGSGDRQYLTGLRMGGERILILVDASASMLAETIVNVVRRRNMSDEEKLASDKWLRAVRTVDWLTAQLPPDGRFQLYTFNSEARPVLPDTAGKWIDIGDREQLNTAVANMRRVVPGDGTSLHNAFAVAASLQPAPDNIYLITDGLPTQGRSRPLKKTVSGEARERHFERAVEELPEDIPINVILFPIEGDPMAPSHYWRLVNERGGTLISPARDWPRAAPEQRVAGGSGEAR